MFLLYYLYYLSYSSFSFTLWSLWIYAGLPAYVDEYEHHHHHYHHHKTNILYDTTRQEFSFGLCLLQYLSLNILELIKKIFKNKILA